MRPLIDRRTLFLAGGASLLIAGDGPDSRARAALDDAAHLLPAERLAALRRINRHGHSRGVRLDVAAAIRGAALQAAIADQRKATARYALQLRLHSGTDATPTETYSLALDRARSLTARADRLLRGEGLTSGTVAERLGQMARDPRYLYSADDAGRDRAVADMNGWLASARGLLPQQFGKVPAAVDHVSVRRMTPADEAAGRAGYRSLPSFDGTAPGVYFVDLHEISRRPQWTLRSVVHHELLPGHMMQLPLQARADPHPLRLAAAGGFLEGWAIYAEQLAAESGIYAQDPRGEIGCLQWLLFRLGRALIDVGVNVFGWSDDVALAFLRDLQGDPVIFAPFEKDIARARNAPGSLAGDVLNWLGFEQLVQRGGDRRRVHDRLLAHGAVPLVLLAGSLAR